MLPSLGELERWAGPPGRARHELLAPLRERLARPVDPPPGVEEALGPLLRLLGEAKLGLPLDAMGTMDPPFAAELNAWLGFDTPECFEGERTFLEVDALHLICVRLELVEERRGRDRLTPLAERLARRPPELWRAVAGELGTLPSPLGDVAELLLAGLLRPHAREPGRALRLVRAAVIEAAGGPGVIRLAHPNGVLGMVACASGSLHTTLRALRAIEPWSDSDDAVAVLNGTGEATAAVALQVRARTGCTGGALLGFAAGSWN